MPTKTAPKRAATSTTKKVASPPVAAKTQHQLEIDARPTVDIELRDDPQNPGRIAYGRFWVRVTPTIAKSLIDSLHPDQRSKKDRRIGEYAADMVKGAWREDSEDTILIDWHSNLIDGQNRLAAVVESGRTIKFWVIVGVDPEVMSVKDTGASRSIGDSLRISGLGGNLSAAQLNVLGVIARRQMHWEAGRHTAASQKGTGTATHSEIARVLRMQPDLYNAAKIGEDAARATRPSMVSASLYGFFWGNANRVNSDLAYTWQSYWLSPSDLPGGSPIAVVRERLYKSKLAQTATYYGKTRSDVLTSDEILALMIRGWNYFIADRSINSDRLQITRGKLSNENFPQFVTREVAIAAAEKAERIAANNTAWKEGKSVKGN